LANRGGTGFASYAIGDLLFANTTTTLSKLAGVAVGNALISGGVGAAPSYGKIGLATHVSGTLPVANGGTGVTSSTGTGSVVLSSSPTLVTPALGTPSSGNLANCTFPTLNQNTTGNAATATALQTARTIGGVSFNGTANINLPGVNTAGNQNTTGSAATLTTARTINGVSFNGSANVNIPNILATNSTTTLATTGVASAVNHLATTNAATGGAVTLTTEGTDTNIGLNITTKGTGAIVLDTGTGAGQIDLKPGASNARLWDDDSSHYYQFVTGDRTANYNITLPAGNVTLTAGTSVVTTRTLTAGDGLSGGGSLAANRTFAVDATVVRTSGAQTIADVKTFTSTIGGSIDGNAATATTLQTARTIGGVSFNGSANINLPGVNTAGNQNTTGSAATLTTTRTLWGQNFNGSANVTGALSSVTTLAMSGQLTNTVAIGTAPLVITSTTRVANLNVATAGTADTLTTARTIGGVSFNGSANINLPGVNTAGNQNTTGTAANVTGTVALANGGTGATTAATALTNLGAAPTASPTFTGVITAPNGTVSAPGIRFTTEANTGFYRSGTNAIGIATAGTTAATFDATGNTDVFGRLRSSGNQSVAAWTTTGQAVDVAAATFTDTSSAAAATVATRTLSSFNTPTLASTNAITVTNASTVYINNRPTAGTNTTVTNGHALHIAAGRTFMAAGSVTIPALAIRDVNTGLYSSAASTLNVTTAGTLAATFASNGDFTAVGNVTAFSDERLKKDWANLPADFLERLARVKSGTYTRIDSGTRQAGSSAQDWQKLLPEVVQTTSDEQGTLALAYGNAALVSAVELAKVVVELRAEIQSLKAKLKD
jgi:hypothetical protein